MRLIAAAMALALTPALAYAQAATASAAQKHAAAAFADQALSDVLFTRPPGAPPAARIRLSPTALSAATDGQVFITPTLSQTDAAALRVINPVSAPGLFDWRSQEVTRPAGGGAVDSLRLSQSGAAPALQAVATGAADPQAFNLTYTRGWPSALMMRAGNLGLDVSPHAGFGVSNFGRSAEAGAMVRLGSLRGAIADRLEAMGVKDGRSFGDRSRWYLFAAIRGQAVGLNVQQDVSGALNRAGWSTDPSSALIGDGQLGVGWRKGGMQASMGYVHREIKVQNAPTGASGGHSDSVAAFSLSFRPNW